MVVTTYHYMRRGSEDKEKILLFALSLQCLHWFYMEANTVPKEKSPASNV